ncbi:EscI/YscI/HrpB family type III secretion system inner rod protein [Labrenzia sp. OB1]|uniref:EscI/YscI/HrpB family type III secretion system inner rod protein n=1 Tax=Labrenzia sp. OB1 TaxID=1561204 RepID=UPI0007B216F8|nr:EscI/YscI/HrpB family type III secretion system inner rod protein [Labrenzia sp. OB1]KZM47400.1 hypothetical protein OA90_26200 [Labrenzia sp. OB1]
MNTIGNSLSSLSIDESVGISIPGRIGNEAATTASFEKFRDTLQLAQIPSTQNAAGVPPIGSNALPVQQPAELAVVRTYGQMDAAALARENERALRGENVVDSVRNKGTNGEVGDISRSQDGDLILSGLSALRDVFDKQTAAVNDATSSSLGGTEKLIATQMEIVKFSLLMDVTSKLTGKSTQTFDTLMKGQ